MDVLVRKNPDNPEKQEFVAIELNRRQHIGGHMFPSEGPGRDATQHFIDLYFPGHPRTEDGRDPIRQTEVRHPG